MKIFFSSLVIVLTFVSLNVIAQSKITWVLKEKADKAYFNKTTFDYTISGFTSANEAAAFYTKLKQNNDVLSVEDKGKDVEGNYNAVITMKKVFEKNYYLNWATRLNISYILTLKGEKKTPRELLAAKQNNHAEGAHH